MASPQKENGYTPIANEVLEQFYKLKLTATQIRIVMAIWRFTYGFSRNEHEMSINFIANAIDTNKTFVSRELTKLVELGIITVVANPNGYHSRSLRFNKNYDEWGYLTRVQQVILQDKLSDKITVISQDNSRVILQDNLPVIPQDNQDKQVLKQNIKQIYCAFFDSIWNLYPNKKGKSKVSKKSIEELHKLGFEKVKECIERYKLEKPDWQQWQHGSTFFNGGYFDYLKNDDVKQVECGGEQRKWQ